jgi:predicted DNA binding protein
MANSTLSEILHRAEESVVKAFVADRLDTDRDVEPPGN